eukprot:GHVU01209083.1.p1 GENE.GHVU01209083.1~~GHVU01209083.1.p1  ORF type:complete len:163 (+),score=18.56 GHVU01209083.1:678-1166(+)
MEYIPGGLTSLIQIGDVCMHKTFKQRLDERMGRLRLFKRMNQPGVATPIFVVRRGELLTAMEEVVRELNRDWNDVHNASGYDFVRRSFRLCGFGFPLPGTPDPAEAFNEHLRRLRTIGAYAKLADSSPAIIACPDAQWDNAEEVTVNISAPSSHATCNPQSG